MFKALPCLTKPAAGRPEVPIHHMRSFVWGLVGAYAHWSIRKNAQRPGCSCRAAWRRPGLLARSGWAP